MADTNPPLPKSGGSGPIIIAAVLMLLLIGGLIVWKVTGSGDSATPSPTVAATPSAPPPSLDEPPPPPPPPPVVEDAGKPDEKEPKKVVTGGGSPCSKVCEGTASAALQSALSGRAGQSRSCYEKALSSNATLEGTLTVGVKVGPSGQVCSARVVSDGLHDPGVSNCVVARFMSSTFPAPQGGCAEVNVPLRFMPKR
jgi:hypothetical protein